MGRVEFAATLRFTDAEAIGGLVIRIMVNPFVPWAADYGSASLIRPTLPTQEFTGIRIS